MGTKSDAGGCALEASDIGAMINEKESRPMYYPASPVLRALICAAAAAAAVAAAVAAPFWFWDGGVLELEVLQFIQQYLDGRTVLAKVFDPSKNDFGTYQARELSYFIDYLDARVFEALMRRGWIAFIPLSAIVSSLASAVIVIRSLRRYSVGLGPATLLALVYLTNYVHIVTMGMFYRATKPLVAPLLMAAVFYLAARLQELHVEASDKPGRRRAITGVTLFVMFLLMGLLDRQGYFYAVAGAALLAAWTLLNRRAWIMAAGAGAAVVLLTAYNWWIGPALVHAVNGYTPGFDYQQIPPDRLQDLTSFRKAWAMLVENTTLLLGSTSAIISGAVVAAAIALGLRPALTVKWRMIVLIVLVGGLASQIVMFGLMIARHSMVYDWIDHRYWYYPLPFQALLFAGLCLLLARAMQGWSFRGRALAAGVIVLLIVGNISNWTDYRNRTMNSRWFSRVYPQTLILRKSLEENDADPRLIVQYFKFYEFCQKLRGS
jgi:hypothetical protein